MLPTPENILSQICQEYVDTFESIDDIMSRIKIKHMYIRTDMIKDILQRLTKLGHDSINVKYGYMINTSSDNDSYSVNLIQRINPCVEENMYGNVYGFALYPDNRLSKIPTKNVSMICFEVVYSKPKPNSKRFKCSKYKEYIIYNDL